MTAPTDTPSLPARAARSARARIRRPVMALVRRALLRRFAAAPDRAGLERGEHRVVILIGSAWGMGGTIRAALNLAGHLAGHEEVEVLSGYRRVDEPFMGAFPAGVTVTALDDQRPHGPRGLERILGAWLRRFPSLLMHPADIRYDEYSLWTDVQLARHLGGGAGVLIGTRPALNLLIADLPLPGWRTIGVEQMNLHVHTAALRAAFERSYGRLDALAVLTERDARSYRRLLGERPPRLARIPNTVRSLDGARADLDAKVVLAAGRLVRQKGFDLLVPAWRRVARARPDWHLRICGAGPQRERLERMIARRGLQEHVTLAPAAEDLGAEMERASIYALSSRYEGFPLVLLEAMGKGMAPVAFDCPTGPGDIIDDHRNGILVKRREDTRALGRRLLEMIEDDELRHACGAAAVESARGYTMEAVGPLWDALIAELRAERRGASSATRWT
jgi:glycosyltransferase involved in cell wall biosynthesis